MARMNTRPTLRFSARITAMRANIVWPFASPPGSGSIAACHSAAV